MRVVGFGVRVGVGEGALVIVAVGLRGVDVTVGTRVGKSAIRSENCGSGGPNTKKARAEYRTRLPKTSLTRILF